MIFAYMKELFIVWFGCTLSLIVLHYAISAFIELLKDKSEDKNKLSKNK